MIRLSSKQEKRRDNMLPEQVSKLNTLIDSLEICAKEKETVRDILSIVINQNLKPEPKPEPKPAYYCKGQHLFSDNYTTQRCGRGFRTSEYLIAYCKETGECAAISLSAGSAVTMTGWYKVADAYHITQAEMDKILPFARIENH